MKITEIKVEKLIPYANNPRNNDEAVDKVAASIHEFGFKVPVVVDGENVIVCGHTRVKAAKKLGLATVPCVVADDLTDAQIKAFRLADNKVSEFATWDFEKLELELADLPEMEMTAFGFETGVDSGGNNEGEPSESASSFNYEEQYGVIVMCEDEAQQEEIYNRLVEEGYSCKVVAV